MSGSAHSPAVVQLLTDMLTGGTPNATSAAPIRGLLGRRRSVSTLLKRTLLPRTSSKPNKDGLPQNSAAITDLHPLDDARPSISSCPLDVISGVTVTDGQDNRTVIEEGSAAGGVAPGSQPPFRLGVGALCSDSVAGPPHVPCPTLLRLAEGPGVRRSLSSTTIQVDGGPNSPPRVPVSLQRSVLGSSGASLQSLSNAPTLTGMHKSASTPSNLHLSGMNTTLRLAPSGRHTITLVPPNEASLQGLHEFPSAALGMAGGSVGDMQPTNEATRKVGGPDVEQGPLDPGKRSKKSIMVSQSLVK